MLIKIFFNVVFAELENDVNNWLAGMDPGKIDTISYIYSYDSQTASIMVQYRP